MERRDHQGIGRTAHVGVAAAVLGAAVGVAPVAIEVAGRADVVALACGTGGTLAGLAAGLAPDQRALGVPVLKGGFLSADTEALQERAFGGRRGETNARGPDNSDYPGGVGAVVFS